MLKTVMLFPGVTLRCYTDRRFRQGCLSIQLVRQMCREEAALNALLPAVLLRGTVSAPDLRDITLRLDDLYGASVGSLVRRIGDYQTTGFHCGFLDERFAFEGDKVLGPMVAFLGELLLCPLLEDGIFCRDYVESEKFNLISAIESRLNNKQAYANDRMLESLCRQDSYGVPRLGTPEAVEAITPEALYAHYRKLLAESPVELFYVGSCDPERMAELLRPLFAGFPGQRLPLSEQRVFRPSEPEDFTLTMDVSQGKLAMGFVTPISAGDSRFAAMQLCNTVLGGGVTGKLFMHLREKLSLCYDIGSSYHSAKGLLTVAAGIDPENEKTVRDLVLAELAACAAGDFTDRELEAARQSLLSGLRGVHDSPGAIEGYYAISALSLRPRTPAEYARELEAVTRDQIMEAAATVRLHTVCFLKGVQ